MFDTLIELWLLPFNDYIVLIVYIYLSSYILLQTNAFSYLNFEFKKSSKIEKIFFATLIPLVFLFEFFSFGFMLWIYYLLFVLVKKIFLFGMSPIYGQL